MAKRHIMAALFLVLLVGFAAAYTIAPRPPIVAQGFTPSVTPQFVGTLVTPSATPAFCITPLPLKQGDIIAVTPGVIIRSEPNASSALMGNFNERVQMRIIGGPVCNGGFNWWNVTGQGVTGWVAEGRGTGYWVRFVSNDPRATPQCASSLKLVSGERLTVTGNVRIRMDPSLESLPLTVVPFGSQVIVLQGPLCGSGLNWWKVRAEVVGVIYDGWMAEAEPSGDLLVEVTAVGDGTVCDFPLNFIAGDRARVTYRDHIPKRLRSFPDLNAPILYDLVLNVPVEIIGGPVCADTYNWWQVKVLASEPVIGWIAEGGPAQYWLAPVIRTERTATPTPIRTSPPFFTPTPTF